MCVLFLRVCVCVSASCVTASRFEPGTSQLGGHGLVHSATTAPHDLMLLLLLLLLSLWLSCSTALSELIIYSLSPPPKKKKKKKKMITGLSASIAFKIINMIQDFETITNYLHFAENPIRLVQLVTKK